MSKKHAHETDERAAAARPDGAEGAAPAASPAAAAAAPEGAPAADALLEAEAAKAELKARVAALEAEVSGLKDQYLRKAAEFENFRKRMNKEKSDAIDFANQSLLLDLIPVIDDFERAIKASEASKDFASLHEGIGLIEKRLVSQLENKWGLVRFESAGTPFDPNRHEAIMMEKVAGLSEPTVAEDFLKGYLLKERVVRSAKVKVSMPLDETAAPGADTSADGSSAGASN